MPFVFTWIPGIHEKIMIHFGNNENNETNEQQQKGFFFISELSNRALAIVANITGHAGLYYYFKNYFFSAFHKTLTIKKKVLGPFGSNYSTGCYLDVGVWPPAFSSLLIHLC